MFKKEQCYMYVKSLRSSGASNMFVGVEGEIGSSVESAVSNEVAGLNPDVVRCRKMVADYNCDEIPVVIRMMAGYSSEVSLLMGLYSDGLQSDISLSEEKNKKHMELAVVIMDVMVELVKCLDALNYIKDGIKKENLPTIR